MINIFKYKDLIWDELFKVIKDLENYIIQNKINIKQEIQKISKIILIKNEYKNKIVDIFSSNLNILFLKYSKSDTSRVAKLYHFLKYLTQNKEIIYAKFDKYIQNNNKIDLFNNEDITYRFYFWESYYSNYIEGTEFEIEEAIEIVNTNKIYKWKEIDTYHVRNYFNFIQKTYKKIYWNKEYFLNLNVDEFVKIIKIIHKNITSPSNIAWKFKTKVNRVWTYYYVFPENVIDTLSIWHILAMDLLKNEEPILAYLFYHFLISEIHPFADWNWRTVRIFTNLLLLSYKFRPIIVSNRFRRVYIKWLSCLSKDNDFDWYLEKFWQIFNENINYKFEDDIIEDKIMEHELNKEDDKINNKWLFDIIWDL